MKTKKYTNLTLQWAAAWILFTALLLTSCVTKRQAEQMVLDSNSAMVASVAAINGIPLIPPASSSASGVDADAVNRVNSLDQAESQMKGMIAAQSNPRITEPLRFRLAMLQTVRGFEKTAMANWNLVMQETSYRFLNPRDQILADVSPALVYWYCEAIPALKKNKTIGPTWPEVLGKSDESGGVVGGHFELLMNGIAGAQAQQNDDLAFYLTVIMDDMLTKLFLNKAPTPVPIWKDRLSKANALSTEVFDEQIKASANSAPSKIELYRRHHVDRLGPILRQMGEKYGISAGWET